MQLPPYRHTEIDFIRPDGSILEASIYLGLTPSDVEKELIKEKFIEHSTLGWCFTLRGGATLQMTVPLADQGVTLGSTICIQLSQSASIQQPAPTTT
jgi:hypothetical protein